MKLNTLLSSPVALAAIFAVLFPLYADAVPVFHAQKDLTFAQRQHVPALLNELIGFTKQKRDNVPGYRLDPSVKQAEDRYMKAASDFFANPNQANRNRLTDANQALRNAEENYHGRLKTDADNAKKEAAAAQKKAQQTKNPEDQRRAQLAAAKAEHANAVHKAETSPEYRARAQKLANHGQAMVDSVYNAEAALKKQQQALDAARKSKDPAEKKKHLEDAKRYGKEVAREDQHGLQAHDHLSKLSDAQDHTVKKIQQDVVNADKKLAQQKAAHSGSGTTKTKSQQQQQQHHSKPAHSSHTKPASHGNKKKS